MGLLADTFIELESLPAHPNPPQDGGVFLYVENGEMYALDAPVPGPGGRSTGGVPGKVWYDTHRPPLLFFDTTATASQAPTAADLGITNFVVGDTVVREADYEVFQYEPGQFGGSLVDLGVKWAGTIANGVPAGGASGQVLSKKSATDYDTQWVAAPSGGGSSAGVLSANTAAKAYRNAAYTLSTTGWLPFPTDSAAYDAGGHLAADKSKYVCPAAGFYQVNGEIFANSTAAGQMFSVAVFKNGALVSGGEATQSDVAAMSWSNGVSDIIQCAAGDTLSIGYYSTAALNIAAGPGNSYFSVVQVDQAFGAGAANTGARAYRAAAMSVAAGATKVPVDTIVTGQDPGSHMDVTSNHRYNAPNAGWYQVNAGINANSTAAGQAMSALVYKNGVQAITGTLAESSAGGQGIVAVASDMIYLNAGDYLELYAFNYTAGALALGAAANRPDLNFLSVVQVDMAGSSGGAGGNAVTPATAARMSQSKTAFSMTTASQWTKIPFDTVSFDPGNHCNLGSNCYTVGQPGTYEVSAQVAFANVPAAGETVQIGVYKNGVQTSALSDEVTVGAGGYYYVPISDLVQCATGDQLQVYAVASSANQSLQLGFSFMSVVQVDQPTPVVPNTGAKAYRNAALALSASTFTRVPLDAVVNDPGAHVSGGRYNITAAGWYQVNAAASANSTAVNQQIEAAIYKNGAAVAYGGVDASTAAVMTLASVASDLVFCNPGDYIELYSYCSAALNWNTGPLYGYLSVVKVDQPQYANNPSVVTALPATPFDGQEIYFVADAVSGVKWHLRYNAGSSSAHKWEYIGGPDTYGVNNSQTPFTTPSTTFAYNLVPNSPTFTIPLAGDYDIETSGSLTNSGGGSSSDIRIMAGTGGPGTFAPVQTADGPIGFLAGSTVQWAPLINRSRALNLAAGAVLEVLVVAAAANLALHCYQTTLKVRPVRVG